MKRLITFRPFEQDYNILLTIESKSVILRPSDLDSDFQMLDLKETIEAYYHIECTGRANRNHDALYDITKPELVGDQWRINKVLTPLGRKAVDSLQNGWIWNVELQDVDLPATEAFYRAALDKGVITQQYSDIISRNKDERLKPILSELLCFRLRASKNENGDYVINKEKTDD